MQENLNAYQGAYLDSFPYHWDEMLLLEAYSRRLLQAVSGRRNLRALSLGIGSQIVSRALFDQADLLADYHIVEGAADIISRYQREVRPPDFVTVHNAYFEHMRFDAPFDLIEMGFVLEHVDDPAAILTRYREFLAPDGQLFVSVPNAKSLHRLLGHAAGLIPDIYALSASDRELGHKRYFDADSIAQLVRDCGYSVERMHGLMLKPLTTAQIQSLQLGRAFDAALIEVGYALPDICNGVLIEARLA